MSYNKSLFKQMVEESKKKKSLSKPKDRIVDPMGQWAHPGEITVIPGDSMATHGYGNVPLYVEANNGFKGVIPPNVGNVRFPGATQFTEYPLIKAQAGLEQPSSLELAKIKAKMAMESHFGNPSARRMTTPYPQSLIFKDRYGKMGRGTHYIADDYNNVFPIIQEGSDGKLFYNQNASPFDREAMRFETPEDARSFAEYYKMVAPMMRSFKKNGGDISIPELPKAQIGKQLPPIYLNDPKDPRIGMYNEPGNQYLYRAAAKQSVRAPIYTNNPNDPRLQAYNDSVINNQNFIKADKLFSSFPNIERKQVGNKVYYSAPTDVPQDKQFNPWSLMLKNNIDYDGVEHDMSYFGFKNKHPNRGTYYAPISPKPVQPVIYQKPIVKQIVKPKPRVIPDLKMVGQDRVQSSVPSFNFAPPRLSTIEKPKGDYVLRYVEYDENGNPVPREVFHNDRSVLDQMMGELVKDPSKTGNWSTQGNYQEGGSLPKAQIGLDNTYLPKPRVNFNYTQGKTYKQIQKEDFQRNLERSQSSRNRVQVSKEKLKTPEQTARSKKTVEFLNRESGYNTPIGNFQEAHKTTLNRIQDKLSQNAEVAGLVSLGYPFISRGARAISRLLPEGVAGEFPKQVIGKGRTIQTIRQMPSWEGGIDRVNNPGFDPERYVNAVKKNWLRGYKEVPKPKIVEDLVDLYRVQEKGFDINSNTIAQMEKAAAEGRLSSVQKMMLNNPYDRKRLMARDKFWGQWFEKDPKRLEYYIKDKGPESEILNVKIPRSQAPNYSIKNFESQEPVQGAPSEYYQRMSLSPETEFILPKDIIKGAKKYPLSEWERLIKEHKPWMGLLPLAGAMEQKKQGGQLPKAQVGTNVPSSTYIKKPKVQIPIGPANDPGIKKYFNTLKKHGEWGNPYTFMMNWYSDPVTKTKLKNIKFKENPVTEMLNQKLFTDYHDVMEYDFARNKKIAKNLWEGFPKEMKDFEEELNEMTYKQYEDLYNKTAGFQRGADSITAISNRPDLDFNKRQKNAVHELTHATPLDDFYSTYFKTKKPKKVLDLKTQNYFSTELHEIYPRIMELRFQMNLKPGQKVTPKMLEKHHNNGDYDLRKYYSPEELAEIMNEVAYNSKINLSQAKHGGALLKAQVGKELPNDVNLANQKKQQLLNWYQGRMNHPDPRISTEAKQVLENMNNNYSESFPSSAIQYKPLEQFIVASKYGSYDPRQHKVQLTNPNISFNDEISKARYLPKKLIKSNREEYENMYNTSLSDEVRGHELLHYFLEKSAMPVIGTKYNKNIYSGYTDPDTYTNLLYEREGKPDLKGRDKLGFTQGAKGAYTWLTGTANTDLSPLPFKKPNPKKMFNQEMYRALMDFRNEFQIDPSKNTTPEDFKNIYQKIQENYQKAIKEKDNNKTLRYEHFLDLFNIHGNDFEKLNNLNNLLVGRSSLKQPMARDGFSVTDTTTKPAGFLDYLKTAASAVFNTPYVAASTISDQVEKSPFLSNPVVNFVDFTGTTNYPNLKQAVRDFKNAKGFWPKIGTGALLGLEGLSSFPVIAPEAKIAKQGVKGTKSAIKKITKKILTPVKGTDRITNKILPIQSLIPVSNFSRLATDFNRGGRAFRGAESLFDTFVNKLESSAAYSGEKVKLRMPDGTILVLNTDDPKYEQLYNSGKLGSWNSVDSSFNIIK